MLFITWSMSSQGRCQMTLWSNNISKARNRKLPCIEVLCVWIHACLHVQLVSWLSLAVWRLSEKLSHEWNITANETNRFTSTGSHTDTNTLRMQHNMQGQPLYMMLKIVIFSLLQGGVAQNMELVRLYDGVTALDHLRAKPARSERACSSVSLTDRAAHEALLLCHSLRLTDSDWIKFKRKTDHAWRTTSNLWPPPGFIFDTKSEVNQSSFCVFLIWDLETNPSSTGPTYKLLGLGQAF